MVVSKIQKSELKEQIVENLSREQEVQKIVLFGSFVDSDMPNDIDIAVFQNSNEKYLELSMKYRKLMRNVSKNISIDVLPLKIGVAGSFLNEINAGETIYER